MPVMAVSAREAKARPHPATLRPAACSFYNMPGKFATIMGPALMGIVGLAVRRLIMPPHPSQEQIRAVGQLATRWSLASVVVLFVVGLVLFSRVDEARGRMEAARLAD
jgi:MFS-type transporter involved in bile tolerance (Atg22 family)